MHRLEMALPEHHRTGLGSPNERPSYLVSRAKVRRQDLQSYQARSLKVQTPPQVTLAHTHFPGRQSHNPPIPIQCRKTGRGRSTRQGSQHEGSWRF